MLNEQILKFKVCVFCLLQTISLEVYPLHFPDNRSQPGGQDSRFMIRPRSLKVLETKTSLAILFTQLPFDYVETAIEIPLFQVENKLGLPAGFTLETSLQSIIVSNQLRMGLHKSLETGKFSVGAGIDGAFLFGKMNIAGFDNRTWGWCMYPGILAGYRVKNIAIDLKGELTLINSLKITSGNEEITLSRNLLSGFSISLFVEQPLWKDHMAIFGFINNFQKYFFPAWPAFSTFNRHYYIPQLYFALVL